MEPLQDVNTSPRNDLDISRTQESPVSEEKGEGVSEDTTEVPKIEPRRSSRLKTMKDKN